jgi:catechol 2,3-dioxygenase-like lactoylglutathione lyase family enzyme
MPHLGLVTVVVRDYDEAVAFYVNALGFELLEDTRIDDEKRWVVVAPQGARETAVLLARAVTGEQEAHVGDQTGGRVGWFLNTDAFDRDYERMRAAGGRLRRGTPPRALRQGRRLPGPVRKPLGPDPAGPGPVPLT